MKELRKRFSSSAMTVESMEEMCNCNTCGCNLCEGVWCSTFATQMSVQQTSTYSSVTGAEGIWFSA